MSTTQHPRDFVFTAEFEEAFVGHLVQDPKIYDAAQVLGLKSGNVVEPSLIRIIDEVYAFQEKHKRHPTVAELRVGNLAREDKRTVEHTFKVLERAIARTEEIAVDTLLADLTQWKIALTIKGTIEDEVQTAYLKGDLDKTLESMDSAVLACRRMGTRGLTATTTDLATSFARDRQTRQKRGHRVTSTGIAFLDEAMDGVCSNELVLLTSETGIGKTQLMTQIGLTACATGKRAHMLALEAEPNEIARRILWQKLMATLAKAGKDTRRYRFTRFAHGDYPELESLEDRVVPELVEKYKNLTVLYKTESGFTIEDTEREVMRVAKTVDLVLLDHLHVIDVDAKLENASMKSIMQRLKDLSVSDGTPIVVAAHLRKPALTGKDTRLIPSLHDIHGSSDISKIATHAIVIASATGHAPDRVDIEGIKLPDGVRLPRGIPTFVQVAKSRTEGKSLTRYVAICFFDPNAGYAPGYLLGTLEANGTKWLPVYQDRLPGWALDGGNCIRIADPRTSRVA